MAATLYGARQGNTGPVCRPRRLRPLRYNRCMMKPFLYVTAKIVATLALALSAVWGALALWYQVGGGVMLQAAAALLWAGAALAALVFWWRGRNGRPLLAYVGACALLLVWWSAIAPRHDRAWADDVARMVHGSVDGDIVTLDDVRHFDWRSDADYTPRWERRRYDLAQLRTVDVALSYWMGPAIAHTLVSFGFADGRYLTFSIEIRKERGESFSAVAGFFKRYETVLVAADERDILRVRTNVRDEDMYLYRVRMAPAAMRSLFLAYLDEGDRLRAAPRFYDTLTANCTTIVFEMARRIAPGLPLDWRLLASGYLDRYIDDLGALAGSGTFEQKRAAAHITARARAADTAPDFSQQIRR